MLEEKYDFYSPSNLKIHELDTAIKDHLVVMDSLDMFTKKHSENVANLVGRICEYMHCNSQFTIHCVIAGYLHDIGKQFIPQEILQKPDKLTDEEFEIMKTHTTIGYKICMDDPKLRPYAAGPIYHHEALNGTGYPKGLTKKDIPYEGQIIRVADEYDAIVSKRQYKTHIGITDTLKILIENTKPLQEVKPSEALNVLSENSKLGKDNPIIVKALMSVVIEDIEYEISCTLDYVNSLKEEIKRLKEVEKYNKKMDSAKSEKKKQYYLEGMKIFLTTNETPENYKGILEQYRTAFANRKKRIDSLYDEIKVIKKLKVF